MSRPRTETTSSGRPIFPNFPIRNPGATWTATIVAAFAGTDEARFGGGLFTGAGAGAAGGADGSGIDVAWIGISTGKASVGQAGVS
jgi:hypothetical protein